MVQVCHDSIIIPAPFMRSVWVINTSNKAGPNFQHSYYSFDIMGDLAFGNSFNMLKDGKDNYFLSTTHMNMVLIGIFSVSPCWVAVTGSHTA